MKLEVKNLEYKIGNVQILKDISLKVEDKQFVGIIGPNGSGKTTLLKNIYRTIKPTSGEIKIDGKTLSSYSLKETAKLMAVVSQFNDTSFDFTVFEMVIMGRSPYKKFMERDTKEDIELVKKSLEEVGLEGYEERKISTLSGGESQRIILARAITQQSECFILDEPTNHLDIKYQLQLMELVKNMKSTVIAAIHDLNIACMFCDLIYVIKDGLVVTFGKPEEILTKDLIKEVFDVNCEIIKDKNNGINIVFKTKIK